MRRFSSATKCSWQRQQTSAATAARATAAACAAVFMSDEESQEAWRDVCSRDMRECQVCGEQGYLRAGGNGAVARNRRTMESARCGHAVCVHCFRAWLSSFESDDAVPCTVRGCTHVFRTPSTQRGATLRNGIAGGHGRRSAWTTLMTHAVARTRGDVTEFRKCSTKGRANTSVASAAALCDTLEDTCPSCLQRVGVRCTPREICETTASVRLACPSCSTQWCLRCKACSVGKSGTNNEAECGACSQLLDGELEHEWSRCVRGFNGVAVRVSDPAVNVKAVLRAKLGQLTDFANERNAGGVAQQALPFVDCSKCGTKLCKTAACNEMSHCRNSATCNACGAFALPWEHALPSSHWLDQDSFFHASAATAACSAAAATSTTDSAGFDFAGSASAANCFINPIKRGALNPVPQTRACLRWDNELQGFLCVDGVCRDSQHDCVLPQHARGRARLQRYRIKQHRLRLEFELAKTSIENDDVRTGYARAAKRLRFE